MRIAIVGSGALGLYYGAKLAKAGNDVRFLLRRDFDAVMSKGLHIHSIDGDFHLNSVRGYRTAEEMGHADLVVIGLKTFANDRYRELISPLVGDRTMLLTLQNGLGNEEALAELFGGERVLGGVAFLASNRGEPGVVHHLGQGRILLGEHSRRGITPRAEEVANLFRAAGVDCRAVPDLVRARWEKLVWNIPFNGLTALMRKPVDELLAHEPTRQCILDMMREVIAAANAQGLVDQLPISLAEQLVTFTATLGSYRPSMQIDREEGRPLELNAIFAIPLLRAVEVGVAMPKVQMLHALLALGE